VQAILNRRVIDLEYQSFRSEKPSHHILHPYYLKEYRNRWYLLAYHDHFREVWVYGLDRVKGLGVVHGKKFIETDFDIGDYFLHHVGITRSGEEPEVPRQGAIHDRVEEEGKVAHQNGLSLSKEAEGEEERRVLFRFHLIPPLNSLRSC
jgi:predicted DNA-binding transcriptional regulator YafY